MVVLPFAFKAWVRVAMTLSRWVAKTYPIITAKATVFFTAGVFSLLSSNEPGVVVLGRWAGGLGLWWSVRTKVERVADWEGPAKSKIQATDEGPK